jgi:hypothetical protein
MHYNQLITGKNKKIATIFYGLFAFNREKVKNICIRIRIDIRISFHHFIKIYHTFGVYFV